MEGVPQRINLRKLNINIKREKNFHLSEIPTLALASKTYV
ncbi:hypothetical protein HMPREF0216_01017 [Clostridium celatum DSM 1785]|uniref:Uncharacterized protein n=1 Tax=Clostridium celatum DSM 1785 TaxID=545697 RepID=L1QJI2_9CLOT|nr:hypothetical protein HMPREF0216_01017 [Clostridium celatum DSM 1785]